jgi:hypothetical protein
MYRHAVHLVLCAWNRWIVYHHIWHIHMPITKCVGATCIYISVSDSELYKHVCVLVCVCVCVCASCSALLAIVCTHVCVYLCLCLCVCVSCTALLFISIDSIISRYDQAFRRWNLTDLTVFETPSWMNIQISCIYMCLRDVEECLSISLRTMYDQSILQSEMSDACNCSRINIGFLR